MAWLLNPPVTNALLSVFWTRNAVQTFRNSLSPVHDNWQLTIQLFIRSYLVSGYSWTSPMLLEKMKGLFT